MFGVDVAAVVARFAADVGVPSCVGIDIPIGLPDAGRRISDSLVRARLPGRASTLFSTPTRAAAEQEDFPTALRVQQELTGAGLSKQAFNLCDKILDVDRWLPAAPCRVVEVHPELSFAVMHGAALAAPKKTWTGMRHRMALLDSVSLRVPADLGDLGTRAGTDDVLDAAAVAWTAMRVLREQAESIPDPPERFSDGWPAAVWV